MLKKTGFIIWIMIFILTVFSGCDKTGQSSDTALYSKADMVIGYDGQDFFGPYCTCMAESENGYYYFDNSYMQAKEMHVVKYLMYFDKETRTSVPVCGQPDCIHKVGDESCNAQFVNSGTSEGSTSYPFSLWYYDGSLYIILMESELSENINSWSLYRVSSDGAIREKYTTLYESSGKAEGEAVPTATIHRGYLYYSIYVNDNTNRLYRVEISKNAEPELICEYNDFMTDIYDFKFYKTGIVYSRNYCIDENSDEYRNDIEYYDTVTGETKIILEDIVCSSYIIAEDDIYYSYGGQIIKYGINNGDSEVVFETETVNYISYDGKYLYIEISPYMVNSPDEHIIYVVDLEGNLIDSIAVPALEMSYFGDSDYLFQKFDLNADLSDKADLAVIKVFDKSQIGTGEHKWIELPLPEY